MTAELTSRLAELDAAATPGPWRIDRTKSHKTIFGPSTWSGYEERENLIVSYPYALTTSDAPNLALIVAMRNALPALLNLVEAARQLPKGWRGSMGNSAIVSPDLLADVAVALAALGAVGEPRKAELGGDEVARSAGWQRRIDEANPCTCDGDFNRDCLRHGDVQF